MFHHFLYTGFSDHDALMAFYEELLEEDAKAMRQWRGGKTPEEYDAEAKCGHKFKLPLLEQFFLTLTRLRLGLLERDIAHRFQISQSTVTRIFATCV